jgi:tetratricopeptide (TPR) repeat protein
LAQVKLSSKSHQLQLIQQNQLLPSNKGLAMFYKKLFFLLFFFHTLTTEVLAISSEELLKKAHTLEDNGFLEEATKSWKELTVVNTNPNFILYAQLKLGNTYLKLKEFNKSIDVLKLATTSHPNNFDAHFSIANSLSAFKNFSKAIKSYQKAITLYPNEGLTYVGLGLSLFGNGNSENAIKALLEANKLFKKKKNISWHQDTRVMIAQIKHFAKFPPHFSNLWTTNNLKIIHDTYEQSVFNSKQYIPSISKLKD